MVGLLARVDVDEGWAVMGHCHVEGVDLENLDALLGNCMGAYSAEIRVHIMNLHFCDLFAC